MRLCPECNADLAERQGRCPQCGRGFAPAPAWRLVFKSPESLRAHLDEQLVHRRLVLPRSEPVAPQTLVRLRLALPGAGGELSLVGKVVKTAKRPPGAKAPYSVHLELLNLDAAKEEILRGAAGGGTTRAGSSRAQTTPDPVPPAASPPAPKRAAPKRAAPPVSRHLGPDREVEGGDLDALIDSLIQPWEPPPLPEPDADRPEPLLPEPLPVRERLPEELSQELTDFILQLVRAVTKSSYYTADHQEAGKAKLGLYAAFANLVSDRPELTLHARKVGEKCSILVYGIFDEPTDLAQALLKGTSTLYVPKLSHYFEANGLLSISFKRALTEEEFHQFVDLLAGPATSTPGAANRIVHQLAENRIHNISVVVVEDRINGHGLSWRVEMALTRLKKDLSVIPLYEHLSDRELQRVRFQVFRDVVRPLRQVSLVRELLENCDRIIEEVEEFSIDQLAEIEAQVLASVPEQSLPALLEGLVDDVAEAKQKGEEQMERLLRLTRRVAGQLSHQQVKNLEDAFRLLLNKQVLALEELPPFLQRKFVAERNANSFLKLRERIFARFDAEPSAEKYQIYLNFFESIFSELLTRADPSVTIAIVERVSEHRVSPPPFEQRPEWAATWLERVTYSSLAQELVRELSQADKLKRESLLELCRRLGDETVPILFKALLRCESVPTRRALTQVLTDLKYASRAFLRRELEEGDPPVDYLLELLRILSCVGNAACAELAGRFLGHDDPAVRIEALDAATTLDAAYGEQRAVAALSDEDPRLRDAALKSLFDRGSTAPGLFAFCKRTLEGLDDSNEKTARSICSRLAGYERGEAREKSVALLLTALGLKDDQSSGWWSSLRRSVAGEPRHASVRVAACQALGRLRAEEARDALTALAKQADPAVKRAALHALERISASPETSSSR